jgi:hypothetical protein
MLLARKQGKEGRQMTTEPASKDKQITIDVPEERVAEFYAFYGRFLAGFPGRHGGRRGGPVHRGHRCGGPHHRPAGEAVVPETGTQTA